MEPPSFAFITDSSRLADLAMQFRATRNDAERREVAGNYSEAITRLVASGQWHEMSSFEDQLPDDWMPDAFFAYWAE